jgi:hypothetical protein
MTRLATGAMTPSPASSLKQRAFWKSLQTLRILAQKRSPANEIAGTPDEKKSPVDCNHRSGQIRERLDGSTRTDDGLNSIRSSSPISSATPAVSEPIEAPLWIARPGASEAMRWR